METFEINGIQYQKKAPIGVGKKNRGINKLMMMATIFGGIAGMNMSGGGSRKRPNVNIITEFALIQQKKSNLSKNDRDWVEWQFHRQYTKIEVGTINDSKGGGEL